MFNLPVSEKPEINMHFEKSVITYNNIIDFNTAQRLINYAYSEKSGLHTRGSNYPKICDASFKTCLINDTNDLIYNQLNYIWMKFNEESKPNITFIEPYEIKIYSTGDKFNYHHDGYGSVFSDVDRKINLVIQLSDENDYKGGELYVGPYLCSKKFGSAIFFPSNYIHKISEITSGTRVSLIGHAWGPTVTCWNR